MFDPTRYEGRRRLYLIVFWIAGFWAAERYAQRLHRQCLARIRRLEIQLWEEFQLEAFRPPVTERLGLAGRGAWAMAEYEEKKAELRAKKAEAYGYHQVVPGYQAPRYHPGALQMPTVTTLLQEITPPCVCGGRPDSHVNRREMRPDRPEHDWQIRTYCTSCHTNVITPVNSQAVDVPHLQAAVRLHLARYHREAVETEARRNHLKARLNAGPVDWQAIASTIQPGEVVTVDQAKAILNAADLISSAQAATLAGDGSHRDTSPPSTETPPA